MRVMCRAVYLYMPQYSLNKLRREKKHSYFDPERDYYYYSVKLSIVIKNTRNFYGNIMYEGKCIS